MLRTPFTGGAEALLRHTGRHGGDARLDGKRTGETVGRLGEVSDAQERLGHLVGMMRGGCAGRFALRSCFWPSGFCLNVAL